MKPHSFLLIMLLGIACNTLAQTVTNVRFEQENKQVKITYTLDKQADISVSISEDGGTTWHAPLKQVSGDVGKQVQPGSKTIYWDVLAEYDQLVGTNICFQVTPKGGENENITNSKDITFTVNGVSFTMVYVEGGIFTIGATYSYHSFYFGDVKQVQVTFSDYYIGQYEVTQGLWQAVMGTTISQQRDKANPSGILKNVGDNYPMSYINWEECQQFISKLNNMLSGQLGGKRFALPTEAQWEYAARGGQKSRNYKYAGSDNVTEVGWYESNSDNRAHLVGQKLPNELGLYDMSGNVKEWCHDWYDFYPSAAQTNPRGPTSGTHRVVRGGHYISSAEMDLDVKHRSCSLPTSRCSFLGMRLALIP